ncbi:MAG: glucose dehydrogenase, partial [Pseudohongiellaceae bacterium]
MKGLIYGFLFLCLASNSTLAQTSYQDLIQDEQNGDDWLSYSGGYKSQRFSGLNQINKNNVDQLKVIWAYQMQPTNVSGAGLQETTPVVADGIMYLTESPSSVSALDARTGKLLWHWAPDISNSVLNIGFPRINRGVAILDDTVYVATLDARL